MSFKAVPAGLGNGPGMNLQEALLGEIERYKDEGMVIEF